MKGTRIEKRRKKAVDAGIWDQTSADVKALHKLHVDAPLRAMSRKCWLSQDRSLQTPPAASKGQRYFIGSMLWLYVRERKPSETESE